MRFAVGSVISFLFVLALFANVLSGAPTPWSDPHRAFTRADERTLEAHYPGGIYRSRTLYVWCAPRKDRTWGDAVWMHSDGRTTWPNQTCWRWPRD